jgi:hypothetical protein
MRSSAVIFLLFSVRRCSLRSTEPVLNPLTCCVVAQAQETRTVRGTTSQDLHLFLPGYPESEQSVFANFNGSDGTGHATYLVFPRKGGKGDGPFSGTGT